MKKNDKEEERRKREREREDLEGCDGGGRAVLHPLN